MKKLFTFLVALLIAQQGFAQEITIPADNANTNGFRQPLGTYFGYERSHLLFTGSEINASGNITSISFYVNSVASAGSAPMQVYFKTSSNSTVSVSTVADVQAGATLVWNGTLNAADLTADSWYTIQLTTPFDYSTNSSLEVLVKVDAGGTGSEGISAKTFRYSAPNPAATRFQSWFQDNTEPTGSGTTRATRPNVKFNFAPSVPNTVGVSAILSPAGSCNLGASMPVTVRLSNNGTAVQTSFPVSYRINNGTPVTQTFTGNLPSGAQTTFTFNTTANLSVVGTYKFAAWTSLAGDQSALDDTVKNYTLTKNAPAVITPVSFTGYDGSNLNTVFTGWSEGNGQAKPIGTSSSWFNSTIFTGNTTAAVNLYTTGKKEWIVSPVFVPTESDGLVFKAATRKFSSTTDASAMGSDDSVSVRVTQDCGVTWQTIFSFTKNNAPGLDLSGYTVPLAAFAGKELRVAFFGTEGSVDDTEDYYFILDDIELNSLIPANTGVAAILAPAGNCGLSATSLVKVRIRNAGTAAQTSIPVYYNVNGGTPVAETFTGNLAPGAVAEYTFATPANLSLAGTYSLNAWTALAGDNAPQNDSVKNVTVTKVATGALAGVDFTGFTGSNLNAVFAGWSEANGQAAPAGTTSSWFNSTIFTGNTAAAINLYSTGKKEWIVSPIFVPSASTALVYKAAIRKFSPSTDPSPMGSDDSVSVRVTQDCGATWQTIFSFTAANAPGLDLADYSTALLTYAGKEIQIGFFGTEGSVDDTEDYYFILDDIQLNELIPNNVGVAAITSPSGNCGLSAATAVTIRIKNVGTAAQTSIPVSYRIGTNAPVTETFTGNLAVGGTALYTFTTTANLSAVGNYVLSAWTSLADDNAVANDSVKNVTVTKVPATPLNPVTFTGFTGGNLDAVFAGWSEGNGQAAPAGTTSAWTNNTTVFANNTVARINIYGAARKEWIVSPVFVAPASAGIRFKAAVTNLAVANPSPMGSDDSVNVRITADCGATWQTIFSITAANAPGLSLADISAALPANTVGKEVRAGIFATSGATDDTEDYYFYIDDIEVVTLVPNNAGVIKMLSPLNGCGLASQAQVKVRVRNFGTAAQTSFPISYSINGIIVTETFTGNLASGDTADFTFATLASVNTPKKYNFICWTSLVDDNIINNDSARYSLTRFGTPIVPVTFNGYEATNLTEIAEGWGEANGVNAVDKFDSPWKSGGIDGNTTARTTLTNTNQNAWIVSPPVKLSGAPELSFKAAVRTPNNGNALGTFGADDRVRVMISTNCGTSWTPVFTINEATSPALTATLSNYSVNLSNYANQEVIIGFLATDSTTAAPGCDVHLDDIEVRNTLAVDGGAVEFISPPAVMQPGVSYPVVVRVRNFGTAAIANFLVSANIGGSPYANFLFDPIAPNASVDLNIGSYTAPSAGAVLGRAYTELFGDLDNVNDTTVAVFNVQTVSIKNAKNAGVKVYPNPSNGSFKISLGELKANNATIRLVNLSGQQVFEGSYRGINGQQELYVQTDNLSKGMYLMYLEVAGERIVSKISIQ